MQRIIWQYWETRGEKPAFVDGLHRLTARNGGCDIVLVTPDNLREFLPDIPPEIFNIQELAHKADMLRALLIARHGGMWLDSDAIVLRDLTRYFDILEHHDFVGFNNRGRLEEVRPWVRVNCFLSRPGGRVVMEWIRAQHAKFPKVKYGWEEIGTDLLHPVCLAHRDSVKILPFETICPIAWDDVGAFQRAGTAEGIIRDCDMVMLNNASLKKRLPKLRHQSCQDIANGDTQLSAIMRHALRGEPVDERTNKAASSGSSWRRLFSRVST